MRIDVSDIFAHQSESFNSKPFKFRFTTTQCGSEKYRRSFSQPIRTANRVWHNKCLFLIVLFTSGILSRSATRFVPSVAF